MKRVFVENLSFKYKGEEEETLNEVSFNLGRGKVCCILGRCDSGKTTLCKAINGLVPHYHEGTYSGNVYIQGESIKNSSFKKLSKKIGYLHQESEDQLIGRTVEEDVSFGPINQGMKGKKLRDRVSEALSLTNLKGYEKRKVNNLSGGETKKLALADLLATGNEIIVMDEPTRGLDPKEKINLFKVIEKLKNKNKTILIATKKIRLIEESDKVILLKNGEIEEKTEPRRMKNDMEKLKRLGLRMNQKHITLNQINSLKNIKIDLDFLKKEDELVKEIKKKTDSINQINTEETSQKEESIIQIDNLKHSYGENLVLDQISLDIRGGEYLGLVGANGSGKTTLAKNISGLLKPDKGTIKYKNKPINKINQRNLAKKIGYVFQNPNDQIFNESVKKEINFSLKQRKISEKERQKELKKILDKFKLEKIKNEFPFNLNYAKRKKLIIAAITAMDPDTIILDEPMAGLDRYQKQNIKDILKKLNQNNMTIIHITHDLDYLISRCDRLAILNQKKLSLIKDIRSFLKDIKDLEKFNLDLPFAPKLSDELPTDQLALKPIEIKKMLRLK